MHFLKKKNSKISDTHYPDSMNIIRKVIEQAECPNGGKWQNGNNKWGGTSGEGIYNKGVANFKVEIGNKLRSVNNNGSRRGEEGEGH